MRALYPDAHTAYHCGIQNKNEWPKGFALAVPRPLSFKCLPSGHPRQGFFSARASQTDCPPKSLVLISIPPILRSQLLIPPGSCLYIQFIDPWTFQGNRASFLKPSAFTRALSSGDLPVNMSRSCCCFHLPAKSPSLTLQEKGGPSPSKIPTARIQGAES